MAVVAQLALEPGVDEVVELPELNKPHVGLGVHQIHVERHPDGHVGVVVPAFNEVKVILLL